MPIYEYTCEECGNTFEELVFGDETPPCPSCKSDKTHKLLSATRFKMPGGTVSAPTGASGGSGCAGCSGGNCSTC